MRAGHFNSAATDVPATGHPGGIVGVFWFSGDFEYADPTPLGLHGELDVPMPGDIDYTEPDPWEFGPYCWEVTRVIELPDPIECRGYQKLWRLPPDVDAATRDAAGLT